MCEQFSYRDISGVLSDHLGGARSDPDEASGSKGLRTPLFLRFVCVVCVRACVCFTETADWVVTVYLRIALCVLFT